MLSDVFETYTFSRSSHEGQSILEEFRLLVEQSQIKIVDIKRNKEQLTVVFRRIGDG
jgi:hypothetical protein